MTDVAAGAGRHPGRRRAWRARPVVDWLLHEGRLIADPLRLVDALAARMCAAGAPLLRLRLGFFTIHPQITVWAYIWTRGGTTVIERVPHGVQRTAAYIGSPAQRMFETGATVRYRLGRLSASDHRLLHELAALGGTDYLMLPMRFSDGSTNVFAVATDRRGGFQAGDITAFGTLCEVLSPVLEVVATRQVAVTLLDTYVGHRTGARVLKGLIKRGDGETLHAALWFSDLRDFTPLTETLAAPDLLEMLNAYFEAISGAVAGHGGEILRFVGDAMLIVFPAQPDREVGEACRAAAAAALDAFAAMRTLNAVRRAAGKPEIRFGVGLNAGEVVYGNVGAPDRLDFTVMGPAVNRTARLESLTKELAVPLLMSSDFAARLDLPTYGLGRHRMKGIADPQAVFALEALRDPG